MKTSLLRSLAMLTMLSACFGESSVPTSPTSALSRIGKSAHFGAHLEVGGAITSDGGERLMVKYVGGDGAYMSDVILTSPTWINTVTTQISPVGTIVSIGTPAAGELVFGLNIRTTGYMFFTGDPSRNVDGRPHAALLNTDGPCVMIGFEETLGGGDEDYNDVLVKLCHDENSAPVANAGADQVVECATWYSAPVVLDASSSSDPDGDALTYTWTDVGGRVVGTSARSTVTCSGMGAHLYYLSVDDGHGATATDEVEVTLADTTAPTITSASVSPASLDAPNKKMVPVGVFYTAHDLCGATFCRITSVTSNEPDDDDDDVEIIGDGRDGVYLRAERNGNGNGRIYTITLTCRDEAGNTSSRELTVTVPKGKK